MCDKNIIHYLQKGHKGCFIMSNEKLAVLIQNGNIEAVAELWEQTKGLFHLLTNSYINIHSERMKSAGVEKEDLIQECYFALLEAVKAYNREKPYKLTTYFNYHTKNRFNALLGFRGKDDMLNTSVSLSTPLGDDENDIELQDSISDETAQIAFDDVDSDIYNNRLQQVLTISINEKLTDLQRQCICLMYYNNMPAYKIAESLGISRDRVNFAIRIGMRILANDSRIKAWRDFDNEFVEAKAYKGVGARTFKERGASTPEYVVELKEAQAVKNRNKEYN